MIVVREIMPMTTLLSISCIILYGASHSALPDAVSVSFISQFTTTSVSTKTFGVSKGYPFILPYIVFLSSFINSVGVFTVGIIPSYLPSSSSDILVEDFGTLVNPLIEFIKSLSVAGILATSFYDFKLADIRDLVKQNEKF